MCDAIRIFILFITYMSTIIQVAKHYARKKKIPFCRTAGLKKKPQIRGIVSKRRVKRPKKPNSAMRNVAKVLIYFSCRSLTVRLPCSGGWPARFCKILIRGGRANDLPGVGYSGIRGVYGFVSYVVRKRRRRSKYGVLNENNVHVCRRAYRKRNKRRG